MVAREGDSNGKPVKCMREREMVSMCTFKEDIQKLTTCYHKDIEWGALAPIYPSGERGNDVHTNIGKHRLL
jgi:hypothetical protein